MKTKDIVLKLFLVVFSITVLCVLSVFLAKPAAAAGGPEQCIADTRNDAHAVNANVVTFCDETYVYDIVASNNSKTPTFISGDANDEPGIFKLTLVNCSGVLGVNIIRPSGTAVQSPEGKQCAALAEKENFNNQPTGQDFSHLCSMKVVQDCVIWDGKSELYNHAGHTLVIDGGDQGTYIIQNKGQDFKGPAVEEAHTTDLNKLQAATSEADTCNAKGGALAFIMCPILNGIATSITWLIKPDNNFGLVQLLKLPPLQAGTESGKVVSTVLNNIIVVVDVFYILLFVVIIFANSLPFNIDNYTVKKALPRLVVAIILTQFSFFICSLAVDIGNVLGFGIPSLLFSATAGVPQFAGAGSVGDLSSAIVTMSPFLAGAGVFIPLLSSIGIIVLVVLFVVVVFGILVAFFWLMARYLIVYFLIFLTPLAFAAMVLPGTQKYFKMWAEDSVKVLLTFPIVTGMLAGSIVVSRILSNVLGAQQLSATGSYAKPGEIGIKEIMVGIIPIIALLAIPKTLKWGGKLSAAVGGAIGGYMGAKAGSLKNAGISGAKAVGKPVVEDTRSRQAARFGNIAAGRERRGQGRGFAGLASQVLGRNYAVGQRRGIAEGAQIEKEIGIGYDSAKGRFAGLSGNTDANINTSYGLVRPKTAGPNAGQPAVLDGFFNSQRAQQHGVQRANYDSRYQNVVISEAGEQYLGAVQRLIENPHDARLIGEVKAGMEHLSNIGETDPVAISKDMMGDVGESDLYSRISGPVTVASEKAPDAGPGGAFETSALRPEQLIAAHHSTVRRMARTDAADDISLAHVGPNFFADLHRSQNRGNLRPQAMTAIRDFATTHRGQVDPVTGNPTQAAQVAAQIDAVIDQQTGQWLP